MHRSFGIRNTKYIHLLERVQHRFLRFAVRTLGTATWFMDHDYGPILCASNLSTLADRRMVADLSFLCKVINNLFDCSELVGLVCLKATTRDLRIRLLFDSKLPRYMHYSVDPLNRTMLNANLLLDDIHLFSCSLEFLRMQLLKQLTA